MLRLRALGLLHRTFDRLYWSGWRSMIGYRPFRVQRLSLHWSLRSPRLWHIGHASSTHFTLLKDRIESDLISEAHARSDVGLCQSGNAWWLVISRCTHRTKPWTCWSRLAGSFLLSSWRLCMAAGPSSSSFLDLDWHFWHWQESFLVGGHDAILSICRM